MARRAPAAHEDDTRWMRRALSLARRGHGRVEPNPMVGCVLVRDGRVTGEGFHRRFGGPHAEVEALRHCTGSLRGATAYVTLEPCCHTGKTPPCTTALIDAGLARVVAATRDPSPRVRGRGAAALRAAGIRVDLGLLEDEARALNAPYFTLVTRHRPWIILKWAQSLDGRIAATSGEARWISGEHARAHAHRVRGRLDAIVVGVNTVLRDDPLLTCRSSRPRRIATRVVLDPRLRTPPTAQLAATARNTPTWIFCGPTVAARRARVLERAGCVLHAVSAEDGWLDLHEVAGVLAQHQMTNVLVEGGGRTLGGFFDARLADELHVYLAPLLIGGHAAPSALEGTGSRRMKDAVRMADGSLRRLGDGWLFTGRLPGSPPARAWSAAGSRPARG